MSDVDKNLSDIFDLNEVKEEGESKEIQRIDPPAPPTETSISRINANSDYDYVRQNLKELIDQGKMAIEGIMGVASEGESPRAYEVVSQIMKSMADVNKDLIDLHKKKKDLHKEDDGPKNQTTNNNLFVGSTKDLQKMLGQIEEGDPESDERT